MTPCNEHLSDLFHASPLPPLTQTLFAFVSILSVRVSRQKEGSSLAQQNVNVSYLWVMRFQGNFTVFLCSTYCLNLLNENTLRNNNNKPSKPVFLVEK